MSIVISDVMRQVTVSTGYVVMSAVVMAYIPAISISAEVAPAAPQDVSQVNRKQQALAREYCNQLAGSTQNEARVIIERLEAEPGRREKLQVAMSMVGKVNDRLDWWLLQRAMWHDYDEDWMDSLHGELARRPELSTIVLRVSRTMLMPHSIVSENMANWHFSIVVAYGDMDAQERREKWLYRMRLAGSGDRMARAYLLSNCVDLRVAWAACGWPEWGGTITIENWLDRIDEWGEWWRKYRDSLQFDARVGHFVSDVRGQNRTAKQNVFDASNGDIVQSSRLLIPAEVNWRPQESAEQGRESSATICRVMTWSSVNECCRYKRFSIWLRFPKLKRVDGCNRLCDKCCK